MFAKPSWPAAARIALLCSVLMLPANLTRAQDCPQPPDHSASLEQLIEQVQQATDEVSALTLFHQMWEYWADAPNEQAQEVLDRGMSKRSSYDFAGAIEDFDTLTAYCPTYAESYNQRAFVHFIQEDYEAALVDLNRVLELSPRHVAALSGRALALFSLSRFDEAREALTEALALNPWLPERSLLAPGGPLAPAPVEEIEL